MFMIANGMGQAASTLIGQSIGSYDVKKAKEYFKVLNHVSLVIIPSILSILFYN